MSTVEVEILGDGTFAGSIANVAEYSINESGSPISMTDLQGGVGGITFHVNEDPGFDGSILLPGQPFEVRDPYAGRQRGLIDNGTVTDDYGMDVEASGALLPLVSQRVAQPYSGILSGALTYYFGICGIDSGFQFDPDLALIQVDLPYWDADVWTQLKKLQAIHQFEIADVAGTIIVRKLRLREVEVRKFVNSRLSYARTGASQIVEVYYYNNSHEVNKQVYPNPKTSIVDRPIISVNAGETTTTNYRVPMWIESIDDPTQVSSLPWDNTSTTSVYSVVDKDGAPVSVGDWSNGGGLVTFAIGDDGRSVDVTVRAMTTQERAPYRIASSSEDLEYQYAALYIAATGVAFEEDKFLWSHTAADITDAPSDAVTTINDPMISTIEEAATVLANAVFDNNGYSQTLEVTATAINRRGETGQPLYPTFGKWDSEHPTTTFGQFDALYPTETFGEYDEILGAAYVDDFEGQAFGGIGGARVRHRDNIYRIRTATSRPGSFNWAAAQDAIFADWDEYNPGLTFGEFDLRWAGKTFEQNARMPFAKSGTYVEEDRNLSTNPRGLDTVGWSSNDGGRYPVIRAVTPPIPHPLGIPTAVESSNNGTLTNEVLVSMYNADSLGITDTPQRMLGVWVLVNQPGYRMFGAAWPTYELPVDQWTWVKSIAPMAAGTFATVSVYKISGNTPTTARAYLTGMVSRAGTTPVGDYFDGGINTYGDDFRTRWLGTPGQSASVLERFIPRVV